MHAYKRKAGKVVVKENLVMPAFLIVTFVALLALLALMYIVFLVAVDAVTLQFVFFELALVAI